MRLKLYKIVEEPKWRMMPIARLREGTRAGTIPEFGIIPENDVCNAQASRRRPRAYEPPDGAQAAIEPQRFPR